MGRTSIFLLSVLVYTISCEADVAHPLLTPGNCRGLWRSDNLPGKCFGLPLSIRNPDPEVRELKVTSPQDCRSLCCNMGDKCVSWQFQSRTNECRVGGPVRRGMEASDVDAWCEPHPPAEWNGRKLLSRNNGACVWGDSLPYQCFGLGPERVGKNGERLDVAGCEVSCCNTRGCEMWQHGEGRGCFHTTKVDDGIQCETKIERTYDGGRKCIPNYCGSKAEEREFLENYEKKRKQKMMEHEAERADMVGDGIPFSFHE